MEIANPLTPRSKLWTWNSLRFRVAFALALALSIEGLMRSNINMAMICMVNRTAVDEISGNRVPLAPLELKNNTNELMLQIIENKAPDVDECEIEDIGFIKSRQAMRKAELAKHYVS